MQGLQTLTGTLRIKVGKVVVDIYEADASTNGGRVNLDCLNYKVHGNFDAFETKPKEEKKEKIEEPQTPVITQEKINKQFRDE